jgi:tyrosyl-tRNA synthetase
MAIPDAAMDEYYRLLLDGRGEQGGGARAAGADAGGTSARDAKRRLAQELVSWLHSPEAAAQALEEWERVFSQHELPQEIEEASVPAEGSVHIPALIAEQFSVSRSEARRLLEQGGVWLGERQLGAEDQDLPAESLDGEVLRVGRRRYRRLRAA